MLQSVDVLIGVAVVMLMVSMSVTLITEWALTLSGMRGKKLLEGVTALLGQIDPKLKEGNWAGQIAEQILTHPMAARAGKKFAEVIQREELIKLVLELGAAAAQPAPTGMAAAAAAGAGGTTVATTPPPPPATAGQALVQALQRAGISDPGATLDAVRMLSMRLEASRPDMATHVREATALITEAQSQFVANVNGWFDQTMDRVSASYTNHSRYWTVGISLFLALFLQLDAFKLVNRLSIDENLRASLVRQAETQVGQPAPTPPAAKDLAQLQEESTKNVAELRVLASDELITLPTSPSNWWDKWKDTSFFGVAIAGLLVSLGAPFWFKALGNLLKLRPSLAIKEDQQRIERQTAQAPAAGPSPAAAAAAAVASGERGDIAAG